MDRQPKINPVWKPACRNKRVLFHPLLPPLQPYYSERHNAKPERVTKSLALLNENVRPLIARTTHCRLQTGRIPCTCSATIPTDMPCHLHRPKHHLYRHTMKRERERKIRCRLIYLATSYGAWVGKQARNLADNPCVCPHTLVDIQRRILVLTLSLALVLLLTRL